MEFFDIHTHTLPADPSQGVVNIRYPEPFVPVPGAWYSVGVHPWDVEALDDIHWGEFIECARHPQVVAIGECGMDQCVHRDKLLRQETLFASQLDCAEILKKPLFIHDVQATGLLLYFYKKLKIKQSCMFHGFRGTPESAGQLLKKGFYLSFGSRYRAETLRTVPLDRLLLETDDAPTPISSLYERAAAVRNMPVDELAGHVRNNVRTLLGI